MVREIAITGLASTTPLHLPQHLEAKRWCSQPVEEGYETEAFTEEHTMELDAADDHTS